MHKDTVVVGVDMGATHIRICLLTLDGQIRVTAKERTQPLIKEGLAAGLSAFISHYLAEEESQVVAIMIGFPASIARDRKTIMSTPNLPCSIAEFDGLAGSLAEHFTCQVTFERDVNTQLFYDVHASALCDKLVLGCYLGTGFGFAVWLNGAPFVGAHGVAGELGHIPLGEMSLRCGCGNPGCLETACSGAALAHWYESAPRAYSLSEVFIYARETAWLARFIELAAKAIATVINLFDPDVILLGGGVIDMQDFPYDPLIERARIYIRKPLPYDALVFAKASSSAFNGATGAARMGLSMLPART